MDYVTMNLIGVCERMAENWAFEKRRLDLIN
jgi:hypothetical protein